MAKKTIINVKKIAFTKLRKLEILTLYNDVVYILSGYDTKAMHIQATCDVLIGMQDKAELLRISQRSLGSHALTPQVKKSHNLRLKFGGIITNHAQAVEKAAFKGTDQLVNIIKPVVNNHLSNLREIDRTDVTNLINNFFHIINDNLDVKDAMIELGFKPFLDELQNAQEAYILTYDERRLDKSKQHKGSTIPMQRELQNILGILFLQVDSYQHTYTDIDYSGLISKLNYTITIFTKLIKTRDTKRKNKKLKVAQEDAKSALEDINKKKNIDKNQTILDCNTTVTTKTSDEKEHQKSTPPEPLNKTNANEKPIIGHLEILKKLDKGKKEDDEVQ